MKEKKVSVMLIGMLILSGCASGYRVTHGVDATNEAKQEMNELYDKWREKGYCLAKDRVYNVQEGGMMSAPVPLCEKSDVVMHTHPLWAEKWANFVDVWVWEEYHRRYEGKRFGIMTGRDEWIMYEKEELP